MRSDHRMLTRIIVCVCCVYRRFSFPRSTLACVERQADVRRPVARRRDTFVGRRQVTEKRNHHPIYWIIMKTKSPYPLTCVWCSFFINRLLCFTDDITGLCVRAESSRSALNTIFAQAGNRVTRPLNRGGRLEQSTAWPGLAWPQLFLASDVLMAPTCDIFYKHLTWTTCCILSVLILLF